VNGFTIYKEYYELITLLTEKDQQELLLAIVKYMFEDTMPTLNDKQMKIFTNLKRPLDKSKKRSKAGSNNTSNEEQKDNKKETKQNQNENKKETKQNQNENKTKAHQDVNVNVSNYDSNYVVNVDVNGSCKEENNNNFNNNINLYSYVEQNYGRTLSSIEVQKIDEWSKEFNVDMLQYAIEISIMNRKQKFQYVEGILRNWKSQGYKSLQDVKENEDIKKSKSQSQSQLSEEQKQLLDELVDYDWLNDSEKDDG